MGKAALGGVMCSELVEYYGSHECVSLGSLWFALCNLPVKQQAEQHGKEHKGMFAHISCHISQKKKNLTMFVAEMCDRKV